MPRTYRRDVPQSPNKSPAACHQLTLRGRSLLSRDSAGGNDFVCSMRASPDLFRNGGCVPEGRLIAMGKTSKVGWGERQVDLVFCEGGDPHPTLFRRER